MRAIFMNVKCKQFHSFEWALNHFASLFKLLRLEKNNVLLRSSKRIHKKDFLLFQK